MRLDVFFIQKDAYRIEDRVVCRMESDNHWHRGKIIEVKKTNADSSDALIYLVTFNFYRKDKNRWANANELLDDAICGDPRNETIGYGILFLDRRSYYGFGTMKAAQIRRLIIVRQCSTCQKFFRFIEVHEKQEHGLGKRNNGRKVKFIDIPQIQMIPNLNGAESEFSKLKSNEK